LIKSNPLDSFKKYECKNIYCSAYNDYVITVSSKTGGYTVSFQIDSYFINVINMPQTALGYTVSETQVIEVTTNNYYSVPQVRVITKDNYLEEIERMKKLETFK
jgi:hypothetical protein